jgi:alkylhydroperoxidase/carboxymuconolactone decarboxylase family protein YurZ
MPTTVNIRPASQIRSEPRARKKELLAIVAVAALGVLLCIAASLYIPAEESSSADSLDAVQVVMPGL